MPVETKKLQAIVEPRGVERQAVLMAAGLHLAEGAPIEITISDLSVMGFRAEMPLDLAEGTLLRLKLPTGSMPAARVVYADDGSAGCAFLMPLPAEEVEIIAGIWDDTATRRER